MAEHRYHERPSPRAPPPRAPLPLTSRPPPRAGFPLEPQAQPPIHGEARVPLPSLTEFLALLLARQRLFELRLYEREPPTHAERDAPLRWLYQQLFVAPDTAKGRQLASLARDAITERQGRWALSWEPMSLGGVTWRPRAAG